MNKKQSKRQRDIKNKLMAAICMLLVSSIMMVSTTYAWFTLSTAPEVTGIQTAVGANGNLEMALLPETVADFTKLDELITSGTGDSMEAANKLVQDANVTWGNLVDVSDSTVYGLNLISLYPSKLNTTTEGDVTKLAANPLSTPEYGSDGRVTELKSQTLTGVYNGSVFEGESSYGVRAVGTSSTMTERQLAHRAAMSAAATAGSQAITVASQSLTSRGNTLANVAIFHATDESDADAAEYPRAQVEAMQGAVNDLLGEGTAKGSLDYIEDALKQYIIANSIATASDESYAATKTAIENATLANLAAGTVTGAVVNDDVKTAISTLNTTISKVTTAKTTLDNLLSQNAAATHFSWNQFVDALKALVDPDNMVVNEIKVGDLTKQTGTDADGKPVYGNMSTLVSNVLAAGGLKLTLNSGAGVYADIADFCGNYSASITIDQISYGGLTVDNLDATMSTQASSPTYLETARTNTTAYTGGNGTGTSSNPISDYYGYILDLAFRTNAAESDLLLQTKAVDRVYADNTVNEDTMGGGSTMSFTPVNGFSGAAAQNLMESIRVVFFETDTKVVVAEARLDKTTAQTSATGTISMDLVMWNGNAKADNAKILDLDQNKAKALSVLVYLDGETVTNADVANGSSSMTGTMNLQFASSATLTPMEYTDLRNGDADDEDQSGSQVTTIRPTVTAPSDVNVSNVAISGTTLGFTVAGFDSTKHTITATINDGTNLTLTNQGTQNGVTGFTATVTSAAEVTSVTITVTDTTAAAPDAG